MASSNTQHLILIAGESLRKFSTNIRQVKFRDYTTNSSSYSFSDSRHFYACSIGRRPLFGSPEDGQQFDDAHASGALFAVGVSSLTICYGEVINGFQANYTFDQGPPVVGPPHGSNIIVIVTPNEGLSLGRER